MANQDKVYDIFIIGGGINGTGIARDAAGRGYSVALAEMNDLASGTSSNSSKLIHGGLRYLEHYEFRLVREALGEREVLWEIAPHVIWPVRIVLPHHKDLRPFWLLRLGLFLYDYIGGRKKLAGTKVIDLKTHEAGGPLKSGYGKAFEYSDCAAHDSRLVVLNAMDASQRSATIMTRTKVTKAVRSDGLWNIETTDTKSGKTTNFRSRVIVNATGPWVDQVLEGSFEQKAPDNIRMVQGSHIIVNRIYDHDKDYIFQNADERIIFVIPYEDDFTLIGTTDHDFDGDASNAKITQKEIDYLCDAASEYFEEPILPEHVVGTFSGVRPLYSDGASKAQEATRDYVLKTVGGRKQGNGDAALINIFGGKLTTYRRLAESVLERVESELERKSPTWTGTKPLPGGDFSTDDFTKLITDLQSEFSFLTLKHARRLIRCYGTNAPVVLDGITTQKDMGRHFGATLYQCEVDYLIANEWAMEAHDVLFLRTKQGLHFSAREISALEKYMQAKV